ncbi:hypothetical protein JCM14469_37530 [Desulfatiferula olefinivorans]
MDSILKCLYLKLLFLLAASIMTFSGCGSSGSDTPQPEVQSIESIVAGIAAKGPVFGGTVYAYPIVAEAVSTEAIASGTTENDGSYSLDLGDFSGTILLQIEDGHYLDEASGLQIDLTTPLRVIITGLNAGENVSNIAITPLTEIATRLAELGGLSARNINQANQSVSQLLGSSGHIVTTLPADVTDESSQAASPEAMNYGLLLAAISQMDADGIGDLSHIIQTIVADLSDGQLQTTAAGLSRALETFIADTDHNNSGVTESPEAIETALTATFDVGSIDPDDIDSDNDGYSKNQGDCDDNDSSVFPGYSTWYRDADDDGYSNGETDTASCTCPVGYKPEEDLTSTSGDCNDNEGSVFPGYATWYQDADNDGYSSGITDTASCSRPEGYKLAGELAGTSGDCNDNDGSVFPGYAIWYQDADNDGYPSGTTDATSCTRPEGYKLAGELSGATEDCNDNDGLVFPGYLTWYQDADNDGYSSGTTNTTSCTRPEGYKLAGELAGTSGDCNDNDGLVFPGYATWYQDADNDGYSSGIIDTASCSRPEGYKLAGELAGTSGDCNDNDGSVFPGYATWYQDADNDGYPGGTTDTTSCTRPEGYKLSGELVGMTEDCDDSDLSIHPGAVDTPNDGIDQDCDGSDAVAPQDTYQIDYGYLQNRTYETSEYNAIRGSLGILKNGVQINESDITDIVLKSPEGSPIPLTRVFYSESYITGSWNEIGSSVDYSVYNDSSFMFRFPETSTLEGGIYTYEVTTHEDETLILQLNYPEHITMPYVEADSITYEWREDGGLHVSWTNPAGDYDQIRVSLIDQDWNSLAYINLPATAQEFDLPWEWVQYITTRMNPSSVNLQIVTRNFADTEDHNNYARGYSDSVIINWGSWSCIDVGANANGFMFVSSSDTTLSTGMDIYIDDECGYAYSQGVNSAIITGPGLPSSGLIYQNMYPDSSFRRYDPSGNPGSYYPIADDEDVSKIPDNAEYTITLCGESAADLYSGAETCTEIYRTTTISGKAPVLNADLTMNHFVSLSAPATHDQSSLNLSGPITFTWTIPSGFTMDEIFFLWAGSIDVDLEPDATSITIDSTGLSSPYVQAMVFISAVDEYDRWFNMGWSFWY